MTGIVFRFVAALTMGSLLIACSSTPSSNHYLLTSRIAGVPGGSSPALGVGPVTIPEYLNRDAMVYRQTDNQLRVNASERWAEPLQDGIVRVLGLNLATRLDTDSVQSFPFHSQRRPDWGVKLRVMRLDTDDRQAYLVSEWLIYRPDSGDAVQRRLSSLQQPLDSQRAVPEQIAEVYSDLFWELSEEIATALEAHIAAGG